MGVRFKIPDNIANALPERLAAIPRPKRLRPPKPINCLNCGQPINGNFCSNCGQEAEDHRTALMPMVHDVMGEFLQWDSKLFRTLIPLLFRPGFLTNEYNNGKRVSYLSPFKMFLTVSVLFFLLLATHTDNAKIIQVDTSTTTTTSHSPIKISVDKEKDASDNSVDGAISLLQKQGTSYDTNVVKLAASPNWQKTPMLFSGSGGDNKINHQHLYFNELPTSVQAFDALQDNPAYPHKYPPFYRHLFEHLYRALGDNEALKKTFLDLLPKTVFFVLPIFALIMYPLYVRTRRYYVEHLAFALHDHTFVFVAFALMLLLPEHIAAWMLPITAIYLYASMIVVYKQHWFKTLLKYWFVMTVYSGVIGLAMLAATIAAVWLS